MFHVFKQMIKKTFNCFLKLYFFAILLNLKLYFKVVRIILTDFKFLPTYVYSSLKSDETYIYVTYYHFKIATSYIYLLK